MSDTNQHSEREPLERADWERASALAAYWKEQHDGLLEQLEAERKMWRKALDSALQYVPLKDHDFIEAIVSNPASEGACGPVGMTPNRSAGDLRELSQPLERVAPSVESSPAKEPR